MKTLTVNVSRPYPYSVGAGLLDTVGERLAALCTPSCAVIVADENTKRLYLSRAVSSLRGAGFTVGTAVIPAGEQSKKLSVAETLTDAFSDAGLDRGGLAVSLGGGVVSDLTGFAAGIYMRGISWAALPTTLLAAADASVGGKTGINTSFGKNSLGLFYQPIAVLCDTDTFSTLPVEELSNGAAEAIKTAVIGDRELFSALLRGKNGADYESIVYSCAAVKGKITAFDECESGKRMLLNLGHTAGHAIEKSSEGAVPHGKAVSIGLAITARACEKLGICSADCAAGIISALKAWELPTETRFTAHELYAASRGDKKRRGNTITLSCPVKIGHCELKCVDFSFLEEFFAAGL